MGFEIRQKGGKRASIAQSESAEVALDAFYVALEDETSSGLQIFFDGDPITLERLTVLSFKDKLVSYKSDAL